MATYNVTADPAMRDYMLLQPGSLRKKRIDELAEQIWSQMNTGSVYKLGSSRSGPDTSTGRGDTSRAVALKQAIAIESGEPSNTAEALSTSLSAAQGPTVESETVKPTATGFTSDELVQRILDQEAALAEEETTRSSVQPASQPGPSAQAQISGSPRPAYPSTFVPGAYGPKGPTWAKAPAVEQPRGLRMPPSEGFYKALAKASMPTSARQESTRTPDTGNLYQTKPLETEYGTMDWRSQTEDITPEQAEQLIGQEEAKKIREEEAFGPSGIAQPENEMISRYENAAGRATNPYSLEPAPKTATPAAPEQPSFLSRLGSGIKDNPETAAAIAALVGGVGSGLMGRGRLAKQQAEQDAANRQAAAYSNAISTLTRGRTTPAMAPEQVRSTPGTAETIFDVLGTLGSGAGQIAGDKRRRDQAAEDRQFTKDIQTRELDIKEYEIEQRTAAAAAKAAAQNITDKAVSGISPQEAQVIRAGLDNLQSIFDSGGPFETGTLSFDRTYGESAAIQNDFETSRNTLIAQIKDLMGLGRLTDRDLQLVIDTLPQRNDSAGAIRGTLRGINNTLSRLQSIYSGGGGMGQATGNQFDRMTANQLADYLEANPNDAAALAEAATR
jgi:hypothetical protein